MINLFKSKEPTQPERLGDFVFEGGRVYVGFQGSMRYVGHQRNHKEIKAICKNQFKMTREEVDYIIGRCWKDTSR